MMPFICSCKVRVELNRNMKSLGVLESKRDPIRKPLKLVRHLIEEQDKVLLSYFAQKGRMCVIVEQEGVKGQLQGPGTCPSGTCMCEDGARGPWPSDQILIK